MTVLWNVLLAVFAFLSGAVFGWSFNCSRNYNRGRRDHAAEIERASGMRDPVCTCGVNPKGCYYHGAFYRGE